MAADSASSATIAGDPSTTPANGAEVVLTADQVSELRSALGSQPAVAVNEDALTAAVATMVAGWLADSIYNSPVSRSVDAINYLTETALPDLQVRIAALVKQEI